MPEVTSSANISEVDQGNTFWWTAYLGDFLNITRMSVAELKQKCKVLAAIPTCAFIKKRNKKNKPPSSHSPGCESFACYFWSFSYFSSFGDWMSFYWMNFADSGQDFFPKVLFPILSSNTFRQDTASESPFSMWLKCDFFLVIKIFALWVKQTFGIVVCYIYIYHLILVLGKHRIFCFVS